jgi:hypothetical protein
MLEAHIASPRGSLYYASGTTAYDLETIRQHLRDAVPGVDPSDVALELVLHDPADGPRIATWLRYIARTGIRTRLSVPASDTGWAGDAAEPVASVA